MSNFMAQTAKKLVREKGILSTLNPKPSHSITIDNREGEGGLETRMRTYGDVTDDVPFGYRPHIRKFRDTILPYIVCCIAIILSPFFLVLPHGCYLSR